MACCGDRRKNIVPKFYLHIDDLDTDPDGTDLPNLAAESSDTSN